MHSTNSAVKFNDTKNGTVRHLVSMEPSLFIEQIRSCKTSRTVSFLKILGDPEGIFAISKDHTTMTQVACSKRSDSGERCRVKKAMKSRGGLTSPPPSLLFLRAPFTSHLSPLSERLEQAMTQVHKTHEYSN